MRRPSPLPQLVLNVPSVANKTPDEVRRALGTPDNAASRPGSETLRCSYRSGAVVVMFENGRATQIVLRDTRGLNYDWKSLSRLGLPVRRPTSSRGHVLRWENYCGLTEISFHTSDEKELSHVYIHVNAKAA